MSADLIHALEQLEKEKGIDKDTLIEAIEAALISAYKRSFGSSQNVRVSIDRETGDFKVFALKKVTANPQNDLLEISVENAKKIDPDFEENDVVEIEVTPRKFGRIAAQTAKQVVVQRIREAERGIIFNEFSNKEGEIVTGVVQRIERKNVIIDLGKAEAILAPAEQIPGEEYKFNDRIKTYIIEVKKTTKGPQIMVSRTHPGIIKRLFELEVPEIYEGIVEIRSISREPGSRTKIAVYSKDDNVDPVGACVGQKGTRVQAIVDELRGEKIDIIKWSSNPEEYISSSLSPAKVVRVDINEEEKSAKVTVPDFQLSLAIGKEGQNARLAAKLTGWKIDIKSESQLRATIEQQLLNYNGNYSDEAEFTANDLFKPNFTDGADENTMDVTYEDVTEDGADDIIDDVNEETAEDIADDLEE
ncbi:transcription termination factor NusA [Acetivibrio straminisolvens]|jgi:N utilization substance protein A|uniref:Transcription termination/antitermination protein NusA n=1 Tax=Acetivibrio straminisolvens JCM 21531 TaxID=1294263 RepID=W4V319_9FIRM|nr:transcription termination factor NusA [Acetivibrio straminisolvens]GAE87512.1 transcription termination protein NusA [Acetivibrio straminisolvens JCM 21531]